MIAVESRGADIFEEVIVTIAIVADSTCDLRPDVAASRQIHVVPLHVQWGSESFRDGIDLTAEEFYARLATSKTLPTTSQPSPAEFAEAFKQAREAVGAEAVLCFTLSAELSSTHHSAVQAVGLVDFPVHVIDSRSTSLSTGFLALTAADARDAGCSTDETLRIATEAVPKQHLYFTVGSLEYLQRGGRIGRARQLVGDLLQLKPVLFADEGEVGVKGTVRTRNRALQHIVDLTEENRGHSTFKRLTIVHAQAEDRDILADMVRTRLNYDKIEFALISLVLGVHLGPGSIGIAFELN